MCVCVSFQTFQRFPLPLIKAAERAPDHRNYGAWTLRALDCSFDSFCVFYSESFANSHCETPPKGFRLQSPQCYLTSIAILSLRKRNFANEKLKDEWFKMRAIQWNAVNRWKVLSVSLNCLSEDLAVNGKCISAWCRPASSWQSREGGTWTIPRFFCKKVSTTRDSWLKTLKLS